MAECIIARGGGRSDGVSSGPPIIADKHTILVTVTDSAGQVINDLSVHCKDGDAWYNYHTNDKGQVLFVTNSGSANITAWNFSINGNYKYIDQIETTKDIDAPVGLGTSLDLSLAFQQSEISFTNMTSNIYQNQCYYGNYKVRVANYVNVFVGGGGGGGGNAYNRSAYDWEISEGGGGGGGGGCSIENNILLNHNQIYLFYIGSGGSAGVYGTAGGTSSAFNIMATGGEGGRDDRRSNEGQGTYGGGNGGYAWNGTSGSSGGLASKFSNWGGGGGAGFTDDPSVGTSYKRAGSGGTPYGADGGTNAIGRSGSNGGGGGGGGGKLVSASSSTLGFTGGRGGGGKLSFTFY